MFRREPFLLRIALLTAASALALLAVDFFFKWTVTREVPKDHVATFVARSYAAFSALSLLAQLVLTRPVVERLGVAWAVAVTPLLILGGAVGALVAGGSLLSVVLLKATDGALRYSVHRMTMELVYLPVPQAERLRVNPLVDGALVRIVQAGARARPPRDRDDRSPLRAHAGPFGDRVRGDLAGHRLDDAGAVHGAAAANLRA